MNLKSHFYLNLFLTDTRSVFQEIQENSTWCSSPTTILQKEQEKYTVRLFPWMAKASFKQRRAQGLSTLTIPV